MEAANSVDDSSKLFRWIHNLHGKWQPIDSLHLEISGLADSVSTQWFTGLLIASNFI